MDKSFILDEIKRTAADNGGKPLGMQGFASETGIKRYVWGQYWARWNQAIAEAGFAPNQLTQPLEDAELLEKYAGLALLLGRLPSDGDLRVKRHSEYQFPSSMTFSSRLGRKPELIRKLFEYCRSRNNYRAVAEMCQAYLVCRVEDVEGVPVRKSKNQEVGFVYLLKSGRSYNIGRSKAIGHRERQLKIQLPEPANTVHVIRTDDPCGIKAYWHKRFEAKRKNGEWFDLDADDIRAFKRRKFM